MNYALDPMLQPRNQDIIANPLMVDRTKGLELPCPLPVAPTYTPSHGFTTTMGQAVSSAPTYTATVTAETPSSACDTSLSGQPPDDRISPAPTAGSHARTKSEYRMNFALDELQSSRAVLSLVHLKYANLSMI